MLLLLYNLIVFCVFFHAPLLCCFCAWILRNCMVWKTCKKTGIKKGWLALIPGVSFYPLGKLAEAYSLKKQSDRRTVKWSVIYLAAGLGRVLINLLLLVPILWLCREALEEEPILSVLVYNLIWLGIFIVLGVTELAMKILSAFVFYRVYCVTAEEKYALLWTCILVLIPFVQSLFFLIVGLDKRFPLTRSSLNQEHLAEDLVVKE